MRQLPKALREPLGYTLTDEPESVRVRKITGSETIAAIRDAGWVVRVHGWRKVKGRWVLARDVPL